SAAVVGVINGTAGNALHPACFHFAPATCMTVAKRSHDILTIGFRGCADLTAHDLRLTAHELRPTPDEPHLTADALRLTPTELRLTADELRRKQRYRHGRTIAWPCASLDDPHSDQFSVRGALQNALGEHRIKVVGDSFCKRM